MAKFFPILTRASSLRWRDASGVVHVGTRSSDLTAFRTRCRVYPPLGACWDIDHKTPTTCLGCAR